MASAGLSASNALRACSARAVSAGCAGLLLCCAREGSHFSCFCFYHAAWFGASCVCACMLPWNVSMASSPECCAPSPPPPQSSRSSRPPYVLLSGLELSPASPSPLPSSSVAVCSLTANGDSRFVRKLSDIRRTQAAPQRLLREDLQLLLPTPSFAESSY